MLKGRSAMKMYSERLSNSNFICFFISRHHIPAFFSLNRIRVGRTKRSCDDFYSNQNSRAKKYRLELFYVSFRVFKHNFYGNSAADASHKKSRLVEVAFAEIIIRPTVVFTLIRNIVGTPVCCRSFFDLHNLHPKLNPA